MFTGSSYVTLDAKSRFSIPTRHRDALLAQCDGQLTLTRHPDGCLLIYPRPEWERRLQEILLFAAPGRDMQRILLGSAVDIDMDNSGRVLVTPELREFAKLDRDATLMGLGHHFELWDRAVYLAKDAKACEAVQANGIPAALGDFRF